MPGLHRIHAAVASEAFGGIDDGEGVVGEHGRHGAVAGAEHAECLLADVVDERGQRVVQAPAGPDAGAVIGAVARRGGRLS